MQLKALTAFFVGAALCAAPILGTCQDSPIFPLGDFGPSDGAWFDPDRSGSGFLFERQADVLAGYYFGYDDNGDKLWYLFNADVPADIEYPYEVDAELLDFTGGACEACEYQAPDMTTAGEVTFTFNGKASASYQINDNPERELERVVFGIPSESFDGQTIDGWRTGEEYSLPELDGQWVFVESYTGEEVLNPGLEKSSIVLLLRSRAIPNGPNEGLHQMSGVQIYGNQEEFYLSGECGLDDERFDGEPYCQFSFGQGTTGPHYFVRHANMGPNHFIAVGTSPGFEHPRTLEAHRLHFRSIN